MSTNFRRGRSVRLTSPPTDNSPGSNNTRSPAIVTSSPNNNNDSSSSKPSPTSPVDKSRLTREAFYRDYSKFTGNSSPQNFTVSHKEIDLFKLFLNVQERNGHSAVTSQNSWIPVFLDVTGSETYSSNTGYYLKLNYERHLLKFEHKMGTKYRVDANRALPSSPAEYAAKNKRQYNEELGLLPSNSNVALRKQRNNRRIQSGTSRISDTDSDLNENLADAIFGGKSSKLSKNKQRRLDTSTDDNSGDEYGGDDFDESILMNDAEFEAKLEELLAQEDPVGENAPRGPPFNSEEEKEAWYTYCENRMRTFQEMYRSLKRRLYALDRRLGNKLPPIQKEEAPLNMHDPNSSDSSSDSEDSVSGEADDNGNTIDNDMSLDTLAEAATANEANINDDSEETALNHLDSDLDEQNNEGKDEQPGKSNSEQSSVIVVRQVSRRTSRGNVNTAADEQTSIENSKQAEAPISMYDMFVEGRKRPSSELARAKMLGLAKTDNEQPPSRSATSRSDRSNSSGGGNRNRRRLY